MDVEEFNAKKARLRRHLHRLSGRHVKQIAEVLGWSYKLVRLILEGLEKDGLVESYGEGADETWRAKHDS